MKSRFFSSNSVVLTVLLSFLATTSLFAQDCGTSGTYQYLNNSTQASSAQTFQVDNIGDQIVLDLVGSTETNYDFWYVTDGAGGSGNSLGSGTGTVTGGPFTSSTGTISFYIISDMSVTDPALSYSITCLPPPDCGSSGTYQYDNNSTQASSAQTFVVDNIGDFITLDLTGETESGYDDWYVTDGAGGGGSILGTGSGVISGGPFTSTTGTISFYVISDGSVTRPPFSYSISCSSPPSCDAPTTPFAYGITASTADFSFTDGNGAPEFEVSYGLSGFTPGSGTEFIATSTNTGLSGLTASTDYDVYVRAICSPGDTSGWSAVTSFTSSRSCPAGAVCASYGNGDTDSDYGATGPSSPSSCPTAVDITVPAGERLDSVSVYYSFVAQNGAYMSEQRSWLECVETGQTSPVANGSGFGVGTINYNRTGLTFAANATGTLTFELHAGRTWGGSGCNTTYNYIENGWFLEAYTSPIPACQDITGLTAAATSSSDVDLSFTDANTGSLGYLVAYTDGSTIDTITPNPTSTSFSVSGLSAQTSYTFSVQALCSAGDTSAAVSAVVSTYGDCSSSGTYAYSNGSSAASSAQTFVANTPGDWINLNFTAGSTETCCDDWYITDGVDGGGNVIATGAGSIVGSYESQTGTISFFVVSDGSVTGTPFQYSVSCNAPLTCFPVRDMAASNITASTADISWTDSASNAGTTEWEVSYGVSGFPVGSGTEVFVSTASASLSGLAAAVDYDVYVRAVCSVGDTSAWSSITFQTACPVYAAPYSMTFDATSTPNCWTNAGGELWQWQTASGTGASTYANTPGGGDHTGNGGAFAALDGSSSNPLPGALATLTSPSIDLSGLTNPRLRFFVFSNNTNFPGDNASFYAIVAGTTDTLVEYAGDDAQWVELTADLSAYAGQTIQIEIVGDHNTMTGSQFYNDLLVDDFFIEETPSCLAPSALAISNVTVSSADLTWTDNNTPASSLFEVSIGVSGFTAGSGTQTFVNSASESFSGLVENTTYDVYVRANCGINSAWSSVASFATLRTPPAVAQGVTCTSGGNASIVFSESFETTLIGWTGNYGTANGDWETPDGATSANTGADDGYNGGNYMNYEASSTTANSGTIVSPAIDLSAGSDDAELSFWMHAYGADMGTLNVGVGTTATGPFTNVFEWTGQFQTSGADAWVNVGADLSAYVGQTIYIAFTQYDTIPGQQFAGDMSIDEMTVTTCIACAAPSSLTASNVTPSSADLAWTENGSATEWEVSYGAPGFAAGSGTQISASATSLSLSSLTANSAYDVYVRSVCSVGDTSQWSVVESFATPCPVTAAPYLEEFSAGALPNCWSLSATSGGPWVFTGTPGYDAANNGEATGTYAWIDHSGADLGVVMQAPDVDLSGLTTPRLAFDYFHYSAVTIIPNDLVVEAWDGAAWNALTTISVNVPGWNNYAVDLSSSAFTGSTVRIRFRAESGGDGSDFYGDQLIDNVSFEETPSCVDVISLTATATSSSSIDVSFTDPNSTAPANGYIVTYDDGSGAQTISPNPTASSFAISGLTASTSYTITVQADCGGGDLSPTAISVTESTYGDCSSSGTYAYTNGSSAASSAQTFVANTPGDFIYLDFTAGSTETCCDDWYITDGVDGGGNVIAFGAGSIVGTYESTTGTISFFVVADGSITGTTFQYSLSCAAPPTCFPVRDLAASNITATSADISWTDSAANAGTTEWEVSYGAPGFTAGSGTESFVSAASASLSGLSGGTSYDVYVRAVCSVGDTSAWSSVLSFNTLCITYTAPYSMTFDVASNPACWTNTGGELWQWQTASGTGASSYANTPGGGDHTGNGGAFAALDGSTSNPLPGALATLTSPSIDLSGLTTPRLRFYAFSNNTVAPGDNASFYAIVAGTTDTLVEYAGDNAAWVELTGDLSAYAGQTIQIEIVGDHNTMTGSQFYNDILVDDFFVEETPSCLAPSAVSFSNITGTTVDVTITDPQITAIQWSVDYGVGNTTDFNERFTSLSGTLTGLTPQTTYDLIVTTTCDGNINSVSTSVYSFTTGCGTEAVPYTEDFTTFLPDACWDEAGSGDPSTGPSGLGLGDWRGSNGTARMNSWQNVDQEWLLTPSFDLGTGTAYQVEFDFGIYGYAGSSPATCGSDDEFQFLISTDGGSTWSALFTADNTWVTSAGGDRQIIDLTSYSGVVQFAFYATDGSISDPQDVDFTIDNFAIQPFSTCLSPSNLSASAITSVSAVVAFNDNNSSPASGFEVEYGAPGFTLGTGTMISVTGSPATLSALTPESSYEVYVRADCGGGDFSAWAGPISFATLQAPPAVSQGVNCTSGGNASVVFSESFETALTGWTGDYGTGNGTWEAPDGATSSGTGANDGYNGGNYMNYEASATTANNGTIVSPAIDLSAGADDAELSFWMHAFGADMGTLNVGVGTSASGPFTTEFTWTGQYQTSGSDPWVNVGVDLSAYVGSTIYIAFTQYDTVSGQLYAGDMCIDEMTVTTCLACAAPSSLIASNVTATSADLGWIENGSATEWEVSYDTSGFTAGSGNEVSASATNLSLSSLTPNTSYDAYVRAICGVGDTSDWSPISSFTTPCQAFVAPYLEEFNSASLPSCWSLSATSGGPWVFTGTPGYDAANNGRAAGSYAWIDHSGTDVGVVMQVADVDVSALTTPRLTFDYFHYSAGNLVTPNDLFVEAWDGTAWNALTTLSNDIAGWNNYAVDLSSSAYSGSLVRIRFRAESGGDGFDYYGDQLIDNVSIEETPSCLDVTSLAASATSSSSIEVSFVDVNATAPANGYIVTYDDGNGAQTVSPNPTASPFTISGLTANTSYTITVQADCGGGDLSPNALSVVAATACDALTTFPHVEDFTTGNASLGCWTIINQGGSNTWGFSAGEATISYQSSTHDDYLISPQWNVQASTSDRVSFDARNFSSFYVEEFDVLLSTTGTSPADFTNVIASNVAPSTVGDSYTYDLSAYVGQDVYVAFYIATTDQYYVYIDNFVIDGLPSCLAPTALSASATSGSTADVSWTDPNSATEWEVSYGAAGFTAGAGTEVSVTSASATLSGLTPEASYDVYVRAICSAGDTSNWSAVASFTTPCASIVPAYLEDFTAGYQPTSCWSQGTGGSPATGPSSTGSSGWEQTVLPMQDSQGLPESIFGVAAERIG